VALSFATLLAWWYTHQGTFDSWHHQGDSFHYYMGSKYFDELGYTRLYHCAAVADAEEGLGSVVAHMQIRNLETNQLESARFALQNPGFCKRHFTPEAWQSFKQDVTWFRLAGTRQVWVKTRTDHGYNPPPTWTMVGALLTQTGPARRPQLIALTLIDPVLLAGMFVALAWAFGWRVMCVALIYWGTNFTAHWGWAGGSILRFDWLAALVVGLCCLKRERPVAAGLLLAWAVGVRIFPIMIVVGLALTAALRLFDTRRLVLTGSQRRFAWAFASGIVGIAVLSSASVGPRSWVEFAGNSKTHLNSDTVNRIGLRPLLAYSHDARLEVTKGTNRLERWKDKRRATFASRRPLLLLIAAGYLVLLTFAVRRQPDWVGAVLGIGIIPVLGELGCYYYGMLLAFACLWPLCEEVGVVLLLYSSASYWGASNMHAETFSVQTSLLILLLVGFVALRILSFGAVPVRVPPNPLGQA
jgi:hypothetical protein